MVFERLMCVLDVLGNLGACLNLFSQFAMNVLTKFGLLFEQQYLIFNSFLLCKKRFEAVLASNFRILLLRAAFGRLKLFLKVNPILIKACDNGFQVNELVNNCRNTCDYRYRYEQFLGKKRHGPTSKRGRGL